MVRAVLGWLLGFAVSCAVAIAAIPAARAEPADRRSAAELHAAARTAFGDLRYREAVALLDRAWRRGGSSPSQLRDIFALAGRAAASMGREAAAELWFQRWLCLDPDAALPPGASPKLQVLLTRARDALASASLTVRAVRRGGAIDLSIRDPLALAAAARVDGVRTELGAGRATLTTARGDIEVLDAYGNVLASTTVEPEQPPVPNPADRSPTPTPGASAPPATAPTTPVAIDTPWTERWSTWAITAGALTTVGIAAWWIADDADAQARDVGDEAEETDLRRRRDLATWISRGAFVGAGAAAIVSVVFYVRSRNRRVDHGADHRVLVAPRPGGASVVWRMAF